MRANVIKSPRVQAVVKQLAAQKTKPAALFEKEAGELFDGMV